MRTNNHRPSPPPLSSHNNQPPLHIFTLLPDPPTSLAQTLLAHSIHYQLHPKPQDLQQLQLSAKKGQKIVVLIEVQTQKQGNNYSHLVFPEDYKFPLKSNTFSLKLYSRTLTRNHNIMHTPPQIIQFYWQSLAKKKQARIQLRSVHSLNNSRQKEILSSRRSPSSIKTVKAAPPVHYQQLFYHMGSGSQHLLSENYLKITEQLKNMPKASSFSTIEELILNIRGRNQKYLLLTNSKNCQLIMDQLKRHQISHFDILVFGQLQSSCYYLNSSIILATNEHEEVTTLLNQHGFESLPMVQQPRLSQRYSMSSTDFKNMMNKVMKQESEYSSSNNIFRSTFRSGTFLQNKPIKHWKVDKSQDGSNSFSTIEIKDASDKRVDFMDKRKVRKFKQPSKSITSQDWAKDYQPLLLQTVSKSSSSAFRHQDANDPPEQILNQQDLPLKSQQRFQEKVTTPLIHPIFSYDTHPHNYPSAVIQEVSEQYRGSNVSSAVNLQTPIYTRQYQPQLHNDKNKLNRYEDNVRVIKDRSQQNYTNSQQSPRSSQLLLSPSRIGSFRSAEVPSPTKINIYKPYNDPTGDSSKKNSQVKSPIKIVKKLQLSQPLQVRYTVKTPEKNIKEHKEQDRGNPIMYSPSHEQKRNTEASNANEKMHPSFQQSFHRQFQGFQRVQNDGIVIYRRKADTQGTLKHNQQQQKQPIEIPRGKVTIFRTAHQGATSPEKQPDKQQQTFNTDSNSKNKATTPSSHATRYQNTRIASRSPNNPIPKSPRLQPYPVVKQPKIVRNLMNDSNFSRMSQLHSDGSILRRNNIRFGVKTKKQKVDPSMLWQESCIKSNIYKPEQVVRKATLSRLLMGEDEIEQANKKLHHINVSFNNFHFLVHEDLSYLSQIFRSHAGKQDRVQEFNNIENMFECIRPQKIKGSFDAGFICTHKHHLPMINPKILPQDYYLVVIDRSKGPLLEINEQTRKIRLDQMGRLLLVQKQIVDAKLYQYVAYCNQREEIRLLADKFIGSEFVVQQVETQFTSQIIDFYYCELPRLTRLYLLCEVKELPDLLKLMEIYRQFNPSFDSKSVKLICLITNILDNDDLILKHPNVTFINNPQDIKKHTDILRYAHYTDQPPKPFPLDIFFYHHKFNTFETRLEATFPGRFQPLPYFKLQDVYNKIDKTVKNNSKNKANSKNYLLLPQNLAGQKLASQSFAKIYMLGKGKSLQPKILRVLNLDELLELLRL